MSIVPSTNRTPKAYDAVIVGAGPNGLSAAIRIAQEGLSVLVLEGAPTIGGGCRTSELTLPGFLHDDCAAVHPLAVSSPAFASLSLERFGLEFVHPEIPVSHALDNGDAVAIHRSLDQTAEGLGPDAAAWRGLLAPLLRHYDDIISDAVGPLRLPRHPLPMARFGLLALRSARGLAYSRLHGQRARAAFAGMAAHSLLPMEAAATGAVGLTLAMSAHASGWPFVRGGSQRLAEALAACLRELRGVIETGRPVRSMRDIPPSRVVLFDLTPRQVLDIAGDELPWLYRKRLARYRYGPGVFKVDFALSGPVPWAAEACRRSGTVHLGGTFHEIAHSERAIARGRISSRPYVLVAQPSLFDGTRAPTGSHTLWAYCHVPNGCDADMSDAITAQIERFAPGIRDLILARHTRGPAAMEAYNANYIGGDINGGLQSLNQIFTRPVARIDPYATPNPRLFFCSSSTPPGGGVHGLCGMFAAHSALRRLGA